jgi:hypothetical protein
VADGNTDRYSLGFSMSPVNRDDGMINFRSFPFIKKG